MIDLGAHGYTAAEDTCKENLATYHIDREVLEV